MRWIIALTKENTLNRDHTIEFEIPQEIADIIFRLMKAKNNPGEKPQLDNCQ